MYACGSLGNMIIGDQSLGEVIAQLRVNLGLSVSDVANAAGLTGPAISKIERGQRNPPWTTVKAIFDGMGVSLELTFRKSEQPQPEPEFFVVPLPIPRKPDRRIHGDA